MRGSVVLLAQPIYGRMDTATAYDQVQAQAKTISGIHRIAIVIGPFRVGDDAGAALVKRSLQL